MRLVDHQYLLGLNLSASLIIPSGQAPATNLLCMRGLITLRHAQPFVPLGYFGAPPKCRAIFVPGANPIRAEQMCSQSLGKMHEIERVGPLFALSSNQMDFSKTSVPCMDRSLFVTEVRIWPR
jgi:hypothetical protein